VKHKTGSSLASMIALAFFIAAQPAVFFTSVSKASKQTTLNHLAETQGAGKARAALDEGRAQLRRFKMYAALGPLEEALRLYTQAGDQNGIGAASDALGDLYQREGNYKQAETYFAAARSAFRNRNETTNANLMLVKLSEVYLLMGDGGNASALFATFRSDGGSASGDGSTGFFSLFGGLANVACSVSPPVTPNSPVTPNEPPFMGHGHVGKSTSVRMDLRITDQTGNPIRNAKVKLVSQRPPGLPDNFTCDCAGTTDQAGRYLAPPIHAGAQLSLNISAPGMEQVSTQLPTQSLNEPVRITMVKSGGGTPGRFILNSAPSLQPCFDLYKSFFAYARLKLASGRANYESGQLDLAAADFQDLLATASLPQLASFKEGGRFRAAAATSLGDVAFRKVDFPEARKRYSEAVDNARRDGRLDLSWAAHAGLGRTLWALSHQAQQTTHFRLTHERSAAHVFDQASALKLQDDSLTAYREALKAVESIIEGSIRADEARTTFLVTTHQVFVEAAGAMAEVAMQAASAGSPAANEKAASLTAEAFKVTEESRSRSLLDLLSETGAQISQGVPPDLLNRKAQNLARQQEIAQRLTGVALAGESPKQSASALETELEGLAREFDSIENQIRANSPGYSSLVRTRSLTLSQVQMQVLDDKTVLLEYCLGDQTSYLWAVTQSGARLFKLPSRQQIEQLVMDFRSQLIPSKLQRRLVGIDVAADEQRGLGLGQGPTENPSAFVTASNALYKAAVEPAAAAIGSRRLLVVADGALNYVPFEALVKGQGGADYASLNYLVKSNEVAYAPSASVLAALRQRGNPTTAGNFLVVADPIFRSDDPRLKGNVDGQTTGATRGIGLGLESAIKDVAGQTGVGLQLARLSGTRIEAEEIAAIARAGGNQPDVWMDLNASEENVRNREIANYRIVHVATHGLLNAERPQFSGLVLSLVGNKTGDGFLRTDEIFNLKLGAPLVMLSACETGLGKEKRGEGVIGLTRAFMYAGAPTIGVSLWSVSDKATAELMTSFYRRLLDSSRPAGPASAMRDAQLTMIAGKKYSAPFYWAPFVLVGEWR
jgi:CHAT domain-containing protein/predicted negative regulator of RcsB-dependent stress response